MTGKTILLDGLALIILVVVFGALAVGMIAMIYVAVAGTDQVSRVLLTTILSVWAVLWALFWALRRFDR